MIRTTTAATTLLMLAGMAASANAQIARPRAASADAPKILIVPLQRESRDSLLSVQIADGMRERVQNAHMTRFNPILKAGMNRMLTESGFPIDVPLDQTVVRQLARFANARLVVEGNIIQRDGDSVLVIARLAETSGTNPQSATASATVTRARARDMGSDLANRLATAHRSFEDVQQCRQKVDARDYAGAQNEVAQALRNNPTSSSAYLCLVAALDSLRAPADSITATLRRASEVDPLNTVVLRQLARRADQASDTTGLIGYLKRILAIDVGDKDMRIGLARMYIGIGTQVAGDTARSRAFADSAIVIIDSGLARSQADAELLQTKAIALAVARRWAMAGETMVQVASADTARVDSLFLFRITNYFRNVPDTTNLLLWTRNASVRFPQQASYFYDLSTLALSRADTAGSFAAAQAYSALRPQDGRGHLLIARIFSARNQVDSALAHAQVAATDSTLRPFASGFFLQAGAAAMRDTPPNWTRAAEMLTQARDMAAAGQAKVRPSFYLGVAQLQLAVKADSTANANRNDCESVRLERSLLDSAEANITAGVAENRQQANTILGQHIPAFRQRSDAFWRNYRCDRTNSGGGAGAAAASAAGGTPPGRP